MIDDATLDPGSQGSMIVSALKLMKDTLPEGYDWVPADVTEAVLALPGRHSALRRLGQVRA